MTRFRAPVLLVLALACAAPALADTVLQFPANPSTGYHWVLDAEASTGLDLVTVVDEGNGPPASDLIGAPSPANFRVQCTGAGTVKLVFHYRAPDGETVAETRLIDLRCGEETSQ